jgi:hypothetical protein
MYIAVSSRKIAALVVFGLFASAADAQIPGLGKLLGGSKDEKATSSATAPSADQLEKDLTSVVVNTSKALSALNEALGLKAEADEAAKNAECAEKGTCGVDDSIGVIQKSAANLKSVAEARQAEGKKLDAKAGASAASALEPGIKTIPNWIAVKNGVQALSGDKTAMIKARGLMKSAPKVPGALTGTVSMINATISYLGFSGVDTKSLKSSMSAATADL